jgi:hypothetical protein
MACSEAYRKNPMTSEEIMQMASQAGLIGKPTYTEGLETFAKLIEDSIYAKQLTLPKPRLTGKFSISGGKFKCTGCTGTWTDKEDAKQHSCRNYQ